MSGFKNKYRLTKANGRPVDYQGIYFVLKLNSDNEVHSKASIAAARAYAEEIKKDIPQLAEDLKKLCIKTEGDMKNYEPAC